MSVPAKTVYIRLPGRRPGVITRHTLWLGPDHILAVHSRRFVEDYRRYYFRDIQALSVRKRENPLKNERNRLLLLLVLVIAGPLTVSHPYLAGLVLVLFALFLASQPNCEARVQTALGAELLPAVTRWSAAQRLFAVLEPKIRDAQSAWTVVEGAVKPEVLQAAAADPISASGVEADRAIAAPPSLPGQEDIPPEAGWRDSLQTAAMLLLLACGILTIASSASGFLTTLGTSYLLCETLLILAMTLGPRLKGQPLAAFVISTCVVGYLLAGLMSVWQTGTQLMQRDDNLTQMLALVLPALSKISSTIGGVLVALSVWGLLTLPKFQLFAARQGPPSFRSFKPGEL